MNLGHELGSAVRELVREPFASRGYWHAIGQITIERVREVVESLNPVRFETWETMDDERTCPICGQLDGMVWPATEGFVPPVHDFCRCKRIYHHTEFRTRLIEQWRDVAVPTVRWEWRTT